MTRKFSESEQAAMASVKAPDIHFQEVCKEFKQCLKEYRKKCEENSFFPVAFGMDMDQQLIINKNKIPWIRSVKDNNQATVFAQCPLDQKLTIFHGFQTAGEAAYPIEGSEFKLYRVDEKNSIWDKILASFAHSALYEEKADREILKLHDPMKGTLELGTEIKITQSGDVKNLANPSQPNRFNEKGLAILDGLDCESDYFIVLNPSIKKKDFDQLFASYDALLARLETSLTTTWNSPLQAAPGETLPDELQGKTQKQIYREYYDAVQAGNFDLDKIAVLGKLIKGAWSIIWDLLVGLKDIFLWLTNPDNFKNIDEELKKALKAADKTLEEMLNLVKDEALLFILGYAVTSYIKLLTPQQAAELTSEELGKLFFDLWLSMFIPGKFLGAVIYDTAQMVGNASNNKSQPTQDVNTNEKN